MEGRSEYDPPLTRLQAAAQAGALLPFTSLEKSLLGMSGKEAQLAYQQSYSLVKYLVTTYGWYSVKDILVGLGDGLDIGSCHCAGFCRLQPGLHGAGAGVAGAGGEGVREVASFGIAQGNWNGMQRSIGTVPAECFFVLPKRERLFQIHLGQSIIPRREIDSLPTLKMVDGGNAGIVVPDEVEQVLIDRAIRFEDQFRQGSPFLTTLCTGISPFLEGVLPVFFRCGRFPVFATALLCSARLSAAFASLAGGTISIRLALGRGSFTSATAAACL